MTQTLLLLVLLSTFLHATWNILAKFRRDADVLFLRMSIIVAGAGVIPSLLAEWAGHGILRAAGPYALLSGLGFAVYYFALARGYHTGQFTQIYPLARAIPLLVIALFDVARGRPPSLLGWAGMGLVIVGCLLVPLDSLRLGFRLSHYRTPSVFWAIVAACGSMWAYPIDKLALEHLSGAGAAAQYEVWEFVATMPWLFLLIKLVPRERTPSQGAGWPAALAAAAFCFTAYWLILFVFQAAPQASYIIAMRQFSIVIGVIAGIILFREPAPAMRLAAAALITGGVVCIALAK